MNQIRAVTSKIYDFANFRPIHEAKTQIHDDKDVKKNSQWGKNKKNTAEFSILNTKKPTQVSVSSESLFFPPSSRHKIKTFLLSIFSLLAPLSFFFHTNFI